MYVNTEIFIIIIIIYYYRKKIIFAVLFHIFLKFCHVHLYLYRKFSFLYVAIDRFIRTLNPDGSSQVLLPEESLHKGDLTPAMDIFSAGCALAELFNEVHDAPFDLSEMLAYCSSEDNDFKHLDNLEDPDIRVNFSSYYSLSFIISRKFDFAFQ